MLNKIFWTSQANPYVNYFSDHQDSMLITWKWIKQIINIDNKGSSKINCKSNDSSAIIKNKSIVKTFKNHFSIV